MKYIIRILYGGRDYVSILFDNESDAPDVEPDDIEQASVLNAGISVH